jgi:hypothetical protein
MPTSRQGAAGVQKICTVQGSSWENPEEALSDVPRPTCAHAFRTAGEGRITPPSDSLFQRLTAEAPDENAIISPERAWEQGNLAPAGMAGTLLEIAERHPAVLLERMRGNAENRPSQP